MQSIFKKILVLLFPVIIFILSLLGFVAYSGMFGVSEFSIICLLFLLPVIYFGYQIIRVARIPAKKMPGWISVIFASVPVTPGQNPAEEILDEVTNSKVNK